jgi:hypothetical protein
MSSCSVCGDHHQMMTCPALWGEIGPLKDPQPTGPRGQDEDDALAAKALLTSEHDAVAAKALPRAKAVENLPS